MNTADVLEILTAVWHARAETAGAVRQRIRPVLTGRLWQNGYLAA